MKLAALCLWVGLLSFQVQASNTSVFSLKVVYGDKITYFYLDQELGQPPKVERRSQVNQVDQRTISEADFNYLVKKANKIKGASNKERFCLRSYIELRTKTHQIRGCLGATNPIASDLLSLANLIGTLF